MSQEQSYMEKFIAFCKQKGFIYHSCELYGGAQAIYDYGPLGVELKNNIKKAWWKAMVQLNNDIVGLDSSILMVPKVWEASGHLEGFTDPMVEDKITRKRYRVDHLLEDLGYEDVDGLSLEQMTEIIKKNNITSPDGNELSEPRQFNLLMKTELGAVEGSTSEIYLRGETCQGIYMNYENVRESMRKKLPFGIAQIGKSFRNEITTKNFIFRMREFEQMEMQYFIHESLGAQKMAEWKERRLQWYLEHGIKKENLRFHQHGEHERAHYAVDAWDIQYDSPFGGWKEMEGIHNRGNWDLRRHSEFSGTELNYFDERTGEKFIPHIIETAAGADRNVLFFLVDAFEEVEGGRSGDKEGTTEIVLKLHKDLAPIKIAFLPLSKKEPLQRLALDIQSTLSGTYMTQYDETGSIGKRYRRQDEIGTPYCVTIDFDSLEDHAVTVRDRDTMKQVRVNIDELSTYFNNNL